MATIAIDYTPAVRQQAGIGRLIRGQIAALAEMCPELDLKLFVAGRVAAPETLIAPRPLHSTPYVSERNLVRIWHRLDLPLPPVEWIVDASIDLLHATDFVLPPSRARRKLLTIHDLAFVHYPETAMPSLHHYLHRVVPRSVARADHLLADSQHTANDLQALWQVPQEKISVVQGAVDHDRFFPIENSESHNHVRGKYRIGDGPFILALGTLQPRKNFVRLVRAFHQARQESRLPHRLVIGGSKGWLFDEIFAVVEDLHLTSHVHFPGFIHDVDLPILYSTAEFFAYPSLYEGFGLPVIESLACGTPVLTADNSCLPEAGGPGALYVDAESVSDIATGLVRLATDDRLRMALRAAGRAHAGHFTWQRSARQLLDAYRAVLD